MYTWTGFAQHFHMYFKGAGLSRADAVVIIEALATGCVGTTVR